jgi:hypothetical protein
MSDKLQFVAVYSKAHPLPQDVLRQVIDKLKFIGLLCNSPMNSQAAHTTIRKNIEPNV